VENNMPRTILTYHSTRKGLARCLWDLSKTTEFVGQKGFVLVLVAVAAVVAAADVDVVVVVVEVATAVVNGQEGLLGKGRV
jgi:hypothetical protein